MNSKGYVKKWLTITVHVLCWLLVFTLPYLLRPTFEVTRELIEKNKEGLIYLNFINRIIWVSLFYLHAYWMIPAFVYKRKYKSYTFLLLLLFTLLFLIDWTLFQLLTNELHYWIRNFIFFNFFPILFILVASMAYRMTKDRLEAERLQKEKETENLKTELSLLRSQVSPHFLFNILNNMVALARKKSDLLEPSLIKLSSLLRYMLYETEEKVGLQKEIEYLQSYIDLQQQRFGKNVSIRTCMSAIDRAYEIEPMLLIPFVENAFKHGTGLIENATIEIELKAEKSILTFSVRNRFNPDAQDIKDAASGIGLTNVQRRLNLLYGHNQSLLITKQDNWFIVSLQIALI